MRATLLGILRASTLGLVLCGPAWTQSTHPVSFKANPGADVQVLLLQDRFVLLPDGSIVQEHQTRMQLNSFAAINRFAGETFVPWDPTRERLEVLQNRTLLPSGQAVVAPANAVVDDLPASAHHNPLWSHLRRKVIIHTALEPGAIVEVAWRRTTRPSEISGLLVVEPLSAEWPIQERVLEVEVPKGTPLTLHAGFGASPVILEEQDRRLARLRLTAIPAVAHETGGPPPLTLDSYALATAGALDGPGAGERILARRLEEAGPAPEAALALVRKAIEGEPDPERRLLAAMNTLAEAMNVSVDLPGSLTGWRLHPLAEVWKAGWASPLEMAALQAKVLEALGQPASPVLLQKGPRAGSPPPAFALRETAAVRVLFDGQERLYDPKEPLREQALERFPGRNPMPALGLLKPAPWLRTLAVSGTVDDKGAVKGQFAFTGTGAAAPHAPALWNLQKLAERLAGGVFEGAKVKDLRVTRMARDQVSFSGTFEGTLAERNALGLITVKAGGITGGITDGLPQLPALTRKGAIALPEAGEERLELNLTLPKGWEVGALPEAVALTNAVGAVQVEGKIGGEAGARKLCLLRRLTLTGRSGFATEADLAPQVRLLANAWNALATREALLSPVALK